jgi:hypothetical protein
MIHVTGTGAVNIPPCAGIRITCNATTASQVYTLVDGAGTTQAIVTSPTVGINFTYYGLISTIASPATFTAGQAGDATISILSRTIA